MDQASHKTSLTPVTWIIIFYFAALVYLTVIGRRFAHPRPLRMAWRWFAIVPLSHFFFALIRLGNIRDAHDLALTEIWADGIEWLALGLCTLSLARLVPTDGERRDEPPPVG